MKNKTKKVTVTHKEINASRKLIFDEVMRRCDDKGISGYERAVELIRKSILSGKEVSPDVARENVKILVSLLKICTPEFDSKIKATGDIKGVIDVSNLPMSKRLLNVEEE